MSEPTEHCETCGMYTQRENGVCGVCKGVLPPDALQEAAEIKWDMYQAYLGVGFNKDQAMMLLCKGI